MNEKPACARAIRMLPEFVDGDLTESQAVWLAGHVESCAECGAALAQFSDVDREVTAWGRRLALPYPAASSAREQLSSALESLPPRPAGVRWAFAAVASIAAGLALVSIAPKAPHPAALVPIEQPQFVEIPYVPPPDPREATSIVRMHIRLATLIAAGYRVNGDPNAVVPADVLVGEDGRAHAIRLLSDSNTN